MNRLEPAQTLPQAQPSKRGPWRLLWLAVGMTALGLLLGVLGMYLSAWSSPDLSSASLSDYYWDTPMLWYLNLLPGVILIWLFYFLLGRCWLAYLAAALTMLGLTAANYYKIQLRGDPLLASDLALISEAGDMAGKYTLELTDPIRNCPALGGGGAPAGPAPAPPAADHPAGPAAVRAVLHHRGGRHRLWRAVLQ